jgi:hypothetical protein
MIGHSTRAPQTGRMLAGSMRSKQAWLAAVAAALGVTDAACHRDATDGPAAVREVPSASAATSVEPEASASVATGDAAPSTTMSVGTRAASVGLASAMGSGTIRRGIGNIGSGACGAVATICGAVTKVQVPAANVTVSLGAGSAAGDERGTMTVRGRLRACANRALNVDPTTQGKVTIALAIGPTGAVTTATVIANSGLIASDTACMATALKNTAFASTGAARTVTVLITQVRQGD